MEKEVNVYFKDREIKEINKIVKERGEYRRAFLRMVISEYIKEQRSQNQEAS